MAKKDTFYFSHDYNSRNDSKVKRLLARHGYLGYGLFWAIIEDLYNNANALPLDCESIAYDLRTTSEVIKSIIFDFDLFVIDGQIFGSKSVQKRLEDRDTKSTKARESAIKRWSQDANALPPQSDPNAIKEKKGKERKGKEIKEGDYTFSDFWQDYPVKVGKAKCEPKFKTLLEEEKLCIKNTIADFKQYKPFPNYTHPNPETYLNQKRWQDELGPIKKEIEVARTGDGDQW